MRLICLSAMTCLLCAAPGQPHFTAREALRAEWKRQPPAFTPQQLAQLPLGDRARLELSLKRIGAPGAEALLPAAYEKPTEEGWLSLATQARTPRERFDALFFLNRLKSSKALLALEGLTPADAITWPRHLHLEAAVASARINGALPNPGLERFLQALQKVGKGDPVRAQAARLRLVSAGKEAELFPPVKATPGSLLALMDAWNRSPWEKRKALALTGFQTLTPESPAWPALGLQQPRPEILTQACPGILSRLSEGTPSPAPGELLASGSRPWACAEDTLVQWYGAQTLTKFAELKEPQLSGLRTVPALAQRNPALAGSLLPGLRKHLPALADELRDTLLKGADPVARAAAIEDLTEAPAELDALVARLWKAEEYDGVQTLLQSLDRWKLPEATRLPLLRRFLQHPCWTARLDAYAQLKKLDSTLPWPTAPEPTVEDRAQLQLAEKLVTTGKPVRLRLTFSGQRQITLRLDPRNAPLNVANLVRLARKGYFDGRRVPRVVPDFVVQMGSPLDTMDGGPGYTVRCENSLDWYGPGSVGMALSGKDTGGSQFFITTNAAPHLTGKYTRVGCVEDPDHALPILDELELGARLERVDVLGK